MSDSGANPTPRMVPQSVRNRNPVGSPPPSSQSGGKMNKNSNNNRRQENAAGNTGGNGGGDREAQEARAALALAAVAQAASSSNRSPAEAAEIAKAHAQNLGQRQQHQPQQQRRHLSQGHAGGTSTPVAATNHQMQMQMHPVHRRGPGQQAPGGPHHSHGPPSQQSHPPTPARPEPRKVQPVPFEAIKSLLRSEIAARASELAGEGASSSEVTPSTAISESSSHSANSNQGDGSGGKANLNASDSGNSTKTFRLLQQLADGDNDSFLLQLLLMEYMRGVSETGQSSFSPGSVDSAPSTPSRLEGSADHSSGTDPDDTKTENWKTTFACERLKLLLSRIEAAYDSLDGMLPAVSSSENKDPLSLTSHTTTSGRDVDDGDDGEDIYTDQDKLRSDSLDDSFESDIDVPTIVPDLLPPCTSRRGDATLEFFQACLGDDPANGDVVDSKDDESASQPQHPQHEGLEQTAALNTSTLTADGSHDDDEATASSATTSTTASSSVLSSMFGSIKRPSFRATKSIGSMFGKKNRKTKGDNVDGHTSAVAGDGSTLEEVHCEPGEYTVTIEREMLGLTVENVLERTVVRTVLAGGPAKKAGAKVGSLIVKVGNIETKNLTHFETIDELRQSQRPLQLVLRQISDESLRSAREEMGRLIRGSGFGRIIDGDSLPSPVSQPGDNSNVMSAPQNARSPTTDRNIDLYSGLIRKRWIDAVNLTPRSKKDEPILRVGEKLIWILTLFIVGLERESERLFALAKKDKSPGISTPRHSQYHHSAKDYADAARSVSKVLSDFVKKRMDPIRVPPPPAGGSPSMMMGRGYRGGPMGGRGGRGRGRGGRGYGPGATMGHAGALDEASSEKLLLQIGDVLQRTRTFLADPTSPPAALLRGELIACLCDILDADTEMKLSEEENVSQTQGGGNTGPITDLGAAGSLLKLIILNCPIMRSPECEEMSAMERHVDHEELQRRFGGKNSFSVNDYHRLHAGNRFLAVVHRLAASRSTSARITACSLGPVLWSHLDFPHQLQLRGVITRALHDVEVIVRKSTATVLHEIAELVFDPRCVPWLVLMCERAMTDPEPLLRSSAMTLTWHLAEHLPNAFLGDASKGSRYLRRLPSREDPIFADVYLLQCKLLPVATRLAEDRAPQVRIAVSAQCDRLCDALGDHWSSVIIDVLVALLSDSDDRVRAEAVLCVPRLADIVLLSSPPGVIPAGESSVLDALIPAAIKLQKDPSSSVRIALATTAGELLTLLVGLQRSGEQPPKEPSDPYGPVSARYEKRHVDDRLIPLVQRLLHDSDPEVTSSALRAVTNASRGRAKEIRPRFDTEDDDSKSITSMQSHTTSSSIERNDPVFLPVLSEEQVLRLLPTLSELANSKQWRVRQSAVEIVPALLGCTDKFETRAEISTLCIRLTNDRVDAVRRTAAECLCLGGSSLGSHGEDVSGEWITALVIPHIQLCAKSADYKQRLLCLKMVEAILLNDVCPPRWKDESANAEGKNTPLRELLKLTLSLADDRIANVRLNVGRVLSAVIHVFGDDECRVIKYALLQQLKKEKSTDGRQDRDVNFYATRCLEKVRIKLHAEPQQGLHASDKEH
eukprot:CAMPEP_0113467582 /NCGR_PEP_ID=MMETSP0014_2-20120614/14889_1 /TAXON_ID=2857 /ORGANISM="Nitzschia sp." /LENGTH=1581 /DNA_ID=CAMNT_0000359895 /DNA_START=545 /DNA_END=5287 /DNA_ORIENTATION=- /assembly_acc=CAM_ASM_000159